jgi:hypothetical protein
LQGVRFEDEIEFAGPIRRRGEEVGGQIFHFRFRKTPFCGADGVSEISKEVV